MNSGWIGVLAKWINHEDFRIAAPAAKALANLDRYSKVKGIYEQHVYLLHPLVRSNENTKADVIFVHGLLGGIFYTWRQRDRNETTLGFIGKREKDKGKDYLFVYWNLILILVLILLIY